MRHIIFITSTIIILASCVKPKVPRNFFPDPNAEGLSRFTDHGYNIASNYINDTSYINPYLSGGNALPIIRKTITNSQFDTLTILWQIAPTINVAYNLFPQYTEIYFSLPIAKNFNGNDFLSFNGKRFSSNTCTLNLLQQNSFNSDTLLVGTANIYFVKITPPETYPGNVSFSGLYSGNIGDSIIISAGRFDFSISSQSLPF